MEKNVKGFVSLFAGLAAFGCIVVSLFVPMEPIKGTESVKFYGSINVCLALVAFALAIIAIVFGAMSKKHIDKVGPRKTGVIIGIFALIISLFATGITGLFSVVTDYANGEEVAIFSEMQPEEREQVDNFVSQLKNDFQKQQ